MDIHISLGDGKGDMGGQVPELEENASHFAQETTEDSGSGRAEGHDEPNEAEDTDIGSHEHRDEEKDDAAPDTAPEAGETEADHPEVRRSSREKKPVWLRSGEYVQSQQHIQPDWSDRSLFLQSKMSHEGILKGMEAEIANAMLSFVMNK